MSLEAPGHPQQLLSFGTGVVRRKVGRFHHTQVHAHPEAWMKANDVNDVKLDLIYLRSVETTKGGQMFTLVRIPIYIQAFDPPLHLALPGDPPPYLALTGAPPTYH